MKKLRTILVAVAMASLMAVTALMVGCGDSGGPVWGKTFGFKDQVGVSWTASYDPNVKSAEDFVKKHFDNVDLTQIYWSESSASVSADANHKIDLTGKDVSSASALCEELKNFYINKVKADQSALINSSIVFGSETDMTVTVTNSSGVYNLKMFKELTNTGYEEYNAYQVNAAGEKVGEKMMSLSDAEYNSNGLYIYELAISMNIHVKLSTPIQDDFNGTMEYLQLSYSVYWSKIA